MYNSVILATAFFSCIHFLTKCVLRVSLALIQYVYIFGVCIYRYTCVYTFIFMYVCIRIAAL